MSQELVRITSKTSLPSCINEWLVPPSDISRVLSGVKTVCDALDSGAPTLGMIAREEGIEQTEAYLKLWIIDLQASLNIKNRMNEQMINFCSVTILNEFPSLNIADVKNVFYGAKTGLYGQLYETLSTQKIIEWFREYMQRRCDEAAARSYSEHYYHKNETLGWKDRVKDNITDADRSAIERAKKDGGRKGDPS